eukprot:CAMPEP_0197879130 /NCGR_PEP_ID=MMETSP1439-20131203/7326_1 /TAXON_ID=66791 /ORGANISM="Gonyaulax spinifera, Strain CCMP409" /LENGTH=257 /DNA_ID=CAMNT_0043498615 /DNA_START=6 /DNA_END=779 /DNA_ORIENTATION=+
MEQKVQAVSEAVTAAKDDARAMMSESSQQSWFDGSNVTAAFEDEGIKTYIGDMYAALNDRFLREAQIDIVVNMMGAPGLEDWDKNLWGGKYHWESDKNYYYAKESCPFASDVERFLQDSQAFYRSKGILYLEEASADDDVNSMVPHLESVNSWLDRATAQVRSREDGNPGRQARILIHCYGGRNRSATTLIGFWIYHSFTLAREAGTAYAERAEALMRELASKRVMVLTRKRQNHDYFIRDILEYEERLMSTTERSI